METKSKTYQLPLPLVQMMDEAINALQSQTLKKVKERDFVIDALQNYCDQILAGAVDK